jgi:carboxylesterase type B
MLWIHGGANSGGSAIGSTGTEPSFEGERLSRHGVVVVTINCRRGVFGFIAHPELNSESPHKASGNRRNMCPEGIENKHRGTL